MTSKYRRIYERACEMADRETWEPVGEQHVRKALAEEGFGWIIDSGELVETGWKQYDLEDFDRDDDRGWYYPSGDEPRVEEFRQFHELLTADAPESYQPYYFRVQKAGKAPAVEYGSWKSEENRLTFDEAVEWMQAGGNVGIAGTPNDALVNVDIDDDEETTPADLKPTLRARSRSRTGFHAWYLETGDEPIPNIPTDTAGEIRTDWQYVVAPGSFVCSASEELPDEADSPGYYTVEERNPVASLTYDELPEVFREFHESVEQPAESDSQSDNSKSTGDTPRETHETDSDRQSAVYDVTAEEVVQKEGDSTKASERWSAIFHGSDTSANMSLSDKGRIQCWRHNVAHGGLQALAVLSGKYGDGDSACRAIGSPHKHSGAGSNELKDDWRLSWYAWQAAKERGYIPSDDPVPYACIEGLAHKHGLLEEDYELEREYDEDGDPVGGLMPAASYNAVLTLIEREYGLDPGRELIGRESDRKQGRVKAEKETASDAEEEMVAALAEEMVSRDGGDDGE